MRLAIMQPYFFPYIGYFQLMNIVDEFVVYDNIQYTKKGWINRNRILLNGKDVFITIPLKKSSDFLNVKERKLSENWECDKKYIINLIKFSYSKAPFFKDIFPLIEDCIMYKNDNLFDFVFFSLTSLKNYLNISTELILSSNLPIDHNLKSVEKVISICKLKNASIYVNPIGGTQLYKSEDFKEVGVNLSFLKSNLIDYKQFDNGFVPFLSIIDVMMFNSPEEINVMLDQFELV
jgi:hypothetical protein